MSARITHGESRGKNQSAEYRIWSSMKQRCSNPKTRRYKHYGEKGISVCERWLGKDGFKNFISDMGRRPEGMTLERVNGNLGYSAANCCWATYFHQNNNRSINNFQDLNGKTQTVTQWAREIGIKASQVFLRMHRGWDFEKALLTPLNKYKKEHPCFLKI